MFNKLENRLCYLTLLNGFLKYYLVESANTIETFFTHVLDIKP